MTTPTRFQQNRTAYQGTSLHVTDLIYAVTTALTKLQQGDKKNPMEPDDSARIKRLTEIKDMLLYSTRVSITHVSTV